VFFLTTGAIYITGQPNGCTNTDQNGMNLLIVNATRYMNGYYMYQNLVYQCGSTIPVIQLQYQDFLYIDGQFYELDSTNTTTIAKLSTDSATQTYNYRSPII
jgi:hypothetical protein